MTTQDLKNNRDKVISSIKYQGVSDITSVMNRMVEMMNIPMFSEMKPTGKNINTVTMEAVKYYLKNIYNPEITIQFKEDIQIQSRNNQSINL